MQNEYQRGEQLVWVHIDDETGEQVNDMVTIMNVRSYPTSAYYTIRIDVTGEVSMSWHDELFRLAT